jgi:hypothetical protein
MGFYQRWIPPRLIDLAIGGRSPGPISPKVATDRGVLRLDAES